MLTRIRHLPSPALVISMIALIVAVGGGSFALAISDKTSDKRIANKQITKRAPGLSVKHARTADKATSAASPRTLASGKTETGSFYAVSNTPSASGNIAAAISFPFPLPAAPTTHYVASGGPAPSACPGTASHPRATPGSLCAYETLNTTGNPAQFNGDVPASKFGAAILAVQSSGTGGSDTIAGTWAATAP